MDNNADDAACHIHTGDCTLQVNSEYLKTTVFLSKSVPHHRTHNSYENLKYKNAEQTTNCRYQVQYKILPAGDIKYIPS